MKYKIKEDLIDKHMRFVKYGCQQMAYFLCFSVFEGNYFIAKLTDDIGRLSHRIDKELSA